MEEKTSSPSTPPDGSPTHEGRRLSDLLRRRREQLLLDWEHALAARHPDGLRHEPLLRDALPGFLDRLADALEHPPSEALEHLPRAVTDEQALQRLEAGLEPWEVALEFSLLRHCIHEAQAREGIWADLDEWAVLHESIDQGIVGATSLYTGVRERMLEALERVSEVALKSQDVETFLPRLLHVLQEVAVSVDGASILLSHEGELRLRSAVGIGAGQALKSNMRFPLHQGITGQVARGHGPRLVRVVSTHPDLNSEFVRQLGLRALYSVPLWHGERLIGVAHMSSRTLFDFSPSDKLLFRTLMRRATSFIVQAELTGLERSARTETQRLLTLVDTLVETSPVGLCLLDRELRFLCVNNTLAGINGYPVAQHLGRKLRDRMPAWAVELLEPCFLQVLERGEPLYNHEFSSPPGPQGPAQHWLGHYYPVRTPDGEVDGLGCVLVNITRLKQVEAELRRASELREQVIGVVGHDLRNPLNAITASVALLARDESLTAGSPRRAVERIRSSAARMARMINDILDFARSNSDGGLPVYRERMDLHELCRSALEELQVAHTDRRLDLSTDGDGWGWWDADRLTQVVGNLVGNALQHGRPDAPVRVEVREEAEGVLLEVHNEGEPIADALRATLFQPFRHGDTGRSSSRSVGLGLYIVQQIARAHGGEARVRSSEQGHTVFTVYLPRGDPSTATSRHGAPPGDGAPQRP